MTNKRRQRYNLLSSTADQMVIAKGIKPAELVCYEVSMAVFGTKPNGDTYLLFEEYLKERSAGVGQAPVTMPVKDEEELSIFFDHMKAGAMQQVKETVRGIGNAFQQSTSLQIIALQAEKAMLERSKKEVIDTLIETEDKLNEANTAIVNLEEKLQEALNQIQRYRGRIDQLMGREEEIIDELPPIGDDDNAEPLPETLVPPISTEAPAEADLFVSMVDRSAQTDRGTSKNVHDDGV